MHRRPVVDTLLVLALCAWTACDAAPPVDEPSIDVEHAAAPPDEMSMSLQAAAPAPACAKVKAVRQANAWRTCTGADEAACSKWGPTISQLCPAQTGRAAGLDIDFRYFGEVDCRSNERVDPITRIVIHNGDHARGNNDNWKCRQSSAHYTIDRDGTIFQHIGEERTAWHARPVNSDTIGIELAIKRKYGKSCNSVSDFGAIAKAEGLADSDVVADMCGVTAAQYASLSKLVADIRARHPIASDGIVGHCEVGDTNHGDPRAFHYGAIGVAQRKNVGHCGWQHIAAIKSPTVVALSSGDGARIFVSATDKDGVEVGDHGYLEDDDEDIKMWFVVDAVTKDGASARVAMAPATARTLHATVVATPGTTPKALFGKAAAAAGLVEKPALGSCATDYTYLKSATIASWTKRANGTIDTVKLTGAGWSNRVCDDSTGLIYVGDSTDKYVTDGSGTKIRFRMKTVDTSSAVAEVFEGVLDETLLGSNRRVVVRARP
ncbi:MAG: peptidoglycan recognition family protein [Nannocystaceae bacterium]